jgi:hypothetical protein
MVDVQRKKSSSTSIEVDISYNEHEAQFKMDDWAFVSEMMEEFKKKQIEEYVKADTIEVPL